MVLFTDIVVALCLVSIFTFFLCISPISCLYVRSIKRNQPKLWKKMGEPSPYLPGSNGQYSTILFIIKARFRESEYRIFVKFSEVFRVVYIVSFFVLAFSFTWLVIVG